jgi:hypothetical protein
MSTKNKRTTNVTETSTAKSAPSKSSTTTSRAVSETSTASTKASASVAPKAVAPVAAAPEHEKSTQATAKEHSPKAEQRNSLAEAPKAQKAAAASKPSVSEEKKSAASLRFTSDWAHVAEGAIVAGGRVTIEYDPDRAKLRHSKSGIPAWGVQAYVKAVPSGLVIERPAVDFATEKGAPVDSPKLLPVTVEVPAGTTELEVWFKNWTAADAPSETWDSNFGKNYRFAVQG